VAVIFYDGKVFSGIICLVLTDCDGWLSRDDRAFFAISDYHADQRADKTSRASDPGSMKSDLTHHRKRNRLLQESEYVSIENRAAFSDML